MIHGCSAHYDEAVTGVARIARGSGVLAICGCSFRGFVFGSIYIPSRGVSSRRAVWGPVPGAHAPRTAVYKRARTQWGPGRAVRKIERNNETAA